MSETLSPTINVHSTPNIVTDSDGWEFHRINKYEAAFS